MASAQTAQPGAQRLQERGRRSALAATAGPTARRPPGRPVATADDGSADTAGKADLTRPGVSSSATRLGQHARQILARLPAEARLDRTCAEFPHVVEALLRRWSNPAAFRLALEELMIDSRGNRQGFPFDVMMELSSLRDYYNESVDPRKTAGQGLTDVR